MQLLLVFREKFGGIYKLINDIDENNFTETYEIIPILKSAKSEFALNNSALSQFNCLKDAALYLDEKLEQIIKFANKGFSNMLYNFDDKKYEALLKCYYLLETNYQEVTPLTKELQNIIKFSIKQIRNKAIKTFVLQNGIQVIYSLENV